MRFVDGKRAIVTGGGTGIGRAITSRLLAAGAEVTIAGPIMDVLEATAVELQEEIEGAVIRCALCDITITAQIEEAMTMAAAGGTLGDCQDFRVWRGIMGNKETQYVTTERTLDTERHPRPTAGRH